MQYSRQRLPFLLLLLFILLTVLWIGSVSAQEDPDDGTIEMGARLFSENCAVCHGFDGMGRVGANLDKNWPSIRPDLRVRAVIANGVPGTFMPAWSQENGGPLMEAEVDAITAYILSWRAAGPEFIFPTPTPITQEPIEAPPGVSGDPNGGLLLFEQNCVMCHGPDGQGRIGATIAKNWPSVRPDLRVRSTIERGVAGTAMPGWSQDFGGPLSADEIDDLVAYILTLSPQPGAPPAATTPSPTPGSIGFQPSSQQILVLFFVLLVIVVIGVAIYLVYRKE
jgi:mono/diheme cytochrome c family protein